VELSRAIATAIASGDLQLCGNILDEGADFSLPTTACKYYNPLLFAFAYGRIDIAECFIKRGASLLAEACVPSGQERGYTSLPFAVSREVLSGLLLLLLGRVATLTE
jgi:ankyrin repeat protein